MTSDSKNTTTPETLDDTALAQVTGGKSWAMMSFGNGSPTFDTPDGGVIIPEVRDDTITGAAGDAGTLGGDNTPPG